MVRSKLDTELAIRVHTAAAQVGAGQAAEGGTGAPDPRRVRVRVLVNVVGDLSAVEAAGLWTDWTAGPIAAGTIAVGDLERVAALDDVASIQAPRPVQPSIHDSVPAIRGNVARQVPPGFSGRNVLVGVVDTGIDIFHGAFRKPDNTTRIVSLFDLTMRQTIAIVGPPSAGTFRVEWKTPPQPRADPPVPAGPSEWTEHLTFPVTAAALQAALEALPSIDPGDVVATGGPLPSDPIVLDFVGRFSPGLFDGATVSLTGFETELPADVKMTIEFGREFSAAEINAALAAGDRKFLSRDLFGHGTHIAGIAGGDGSQSGTNENENCHRKGYYVGVAPEVDLVVVRIVNSHDVVRAVRHIFTQGWRPAGTPERPVVANLSVGTNEGPHDGTDAMELAIDGLLDGTTGRAVVVAASNDGGLFDHEKPGQVLGTRGGTHGFKPVDPNREATFQFVVADGDRVEDQFEMWYAGQGRLSVNLTTPAPQSVSLPSAVAAGAGVQQVQLANHPVDITSDLNNGPNQKHHIGIVLKPTPGGTIQSGTWTITVRETAGTATEVDCWIMTETRDPNPRFILADQDRTRTIATPATARNVITVGAYNAADGTLADFSSRGPTTDNRSKPDLVAPGVGITSARSGARSVRCKCDCCVEFYIVESGTSSAAPHVTGVVALMLEANPNLSFADIKAKLANSHFDPDPNTGPLPNFDWGAGKIHAEKAVRAALSATPAAPADPTPEPAAPEAEQAEPIFLPAAAYPAARLPLEAQVNLLHHRVAASPVGQLLAALVSEHVDEVSRLINSDRRVLVAWHRMDGPTLLGLLLRDADRDVPIPRTLGGRSVATGLAQLLDALAATGSTALRAAIANHRGLLLAVPGARLADLDGEARAG
jgi:subtilisin family serine protease